MDEREFDELYEREWSSLVGQVTLVCGDPVEAADCVQEAFARAWEHRGSLTADAGGWVRTAALRVSVSRWRRSRNAVLAWARSATRPVPHDLDPARGDAFDGELWEALRGLPAPQREAVALHHLLDLGVQEVADLVGAPTGTVKARLSRGRAALAARLADGRPPSTSTPPTSTPTVPTTPVRSTTAGGAR